MHSTVNFTANSIIIKFPQASFSAFVVSYKIRYQICAYRTNLHADIDISVTLKWCTIKTNTVLCNDLKARLVRHFTDIRKRGGKLLTTGKALNTKDI